jgi:hypothetical protein
MGKRKKQLCPSLDAYSCFYSTLFIHPIREQPWGKRMMRLYDPDDHIVEIGEPMEAVVWRFYQQGLSIELISKRSSMPPEFVERVIEEHGEAGQESGN